MLIRFLTLGLILSSLIGQPVLASDNASTGAGAPEPGQPCWCLVGGVTFLADNPEMCDKAGGQAVAREKTATSAQGRAGDNVLCRVGGVVMLGPDRDGCLRAGGEVVPQAGSVGVVPWTPRTSGEKTTGE